MDTNVRRSRTGEMRESRNRHGEQDEPESHHGIPLDIVQDDRERIEADGEEGVPAFHIGDPELPGQAVRSEEGTDECPRRGRGSGEAEQGPEGEQDPEEEERQPSRNLDKRLRGKRVGRRHDDADDDPDQAHSKRLGRGPRLAEYEVVPSWASANHSEVE